MKILVVEDDFTSRVLLQKILTPLGEVHIAVNGREAIEAFRVALATPDIYHLICLDIMMPEMDGQAALKEIRRLEEEKGIAFSNGVKILMTTALSDKANVFSSFRELCNAYVVKPFDKAKILDNLRSLKLID